MALTAKSRISFMARGARFLKLTPWTYTLGESSNQSSVQNAIPRLGGHRADFIKLIVGESYSTVKMNGVSRKTVSFLAIARLEDTPTRGRQHHQ